MTWKFRPPTLSQRPSGSRRAEDLLGDVGPDDADEAGVRLVHALEMAAARELDDRADLVVEVGHAADLGLLERLAAVLDRRAGRGGGADELAGGAVGPDEVALDQGDVLPLHLLAEVLEGRPDHGELLDREVVGPVEGHLRVDVVVEALDDGDDGDDGQDADDDAEKGQEGAELVGPQRDEGHRERFFELQLGHGCSLSILPYIYESPKVGFRLRRARRSSPNGPVGPAGTSSPYPI